MLPGTGKKITRRSVQCSVFVTSNSLLKLCFFNFGLRRSNEDYISMNNKLSGFLIFLMSLLEASNEIILPTAISVVYIYMLSTELFTKRQGK